MNNFINSMHVPKKFIAFPKIFTLNPKYFDRSDDGFPMVHKEFYDAPEK